MRKGRIILAAAGIVTAAAAAGYVFWNRRSAWKRRKAEESGTGFAEDGDEPDFLEGLSEDDLFGPDEDMLLMADQVEYLDFCTGRLDKLGGEVQERSQKMYALISRRNIRTEEKERRLKDMVVENMNACHQMAACLDGMAGVIQMGFSEDFDRYCSAMDLGTETDEKEAEEADE